MKRMSLLVCTAVILGAIAGPVAALDRTHLTTYFVLSTENQFYLVPVGFSAPKTDRPELAALQALIDGPPEGSIVRTLVPKGTRILGYKLEGDTATVDFSGEILRANVGSHGELLLLTSIVATLAQFPEVEWVRILADGRPVETLAGHVDISGPISTHDPYPSEARFKGFSDDDGHWAEGEITTLYARSIVGGFPDGGFKPQEQVTRAQFVKMLVMAMGWGDAAGSPAGGAENGEGAPPATQAFSDVPQDAWYRSYLDTAIARHAVNPADYGGVFGGDVPITRREVAVMLVRAKGLEEEAIGRRGAILPYTDTSAQRDWAKGYLAVIGDHRLMNGYPDGTFRPHGRLTRAEASAVITRLLGLGGPNVFLLGPEDDSAVSRVVLVTGVARVFEGTVSARIKQGGSVIAEEFTTASEGAPGWGFYGMLLEIPPGTHGTLTVEALTHSAKDGSEQDTVSRTVVVGQ